MQHTAFALILTALFIPIVSAQVVVNSQDWKDVYSGLQYGAITDQPAHFVTDTQQATRILARLNPQEPILLITGNQQAMPGFRSLVTSRGFEVEDVQSSDPIDTNHDLVRRANPEQIIVVDDAYGYNAISVGTYANMQRAGVVFVSQDTQSLIQDISPQEVLVYGHIPTTLLETIEGQVTNTINNQDRFDDNFALVNLFTEQFASQTIILTNGEIIEQQLINGNSPTVFIGRQTVPERVTQFIQDQQVQTAVLIGNALAPNANIIKDRTGISIFIKFAQGRDQQQFGLDLFNVPTPNPLIQVARAEYDASQQVLLVTYQNPGEIATYFSATLVGEETVEDTQAIFIEAGSHKTIRYSTTNPAEQVDYTLLYGASPRTLDLIVQGSVAVDEIQINDQSQIEVSSAAYDTRTEAFIVDVENTENVDAYVLIEAVDVRIGNERVRIGSEVVRVRAGQKNTIELFATLSERDLERNNEISLELFFGQREFSLVHFQRVTLGFSVQETSPFSWTWIVIIFAIAIVLGWIITRKNTT